MDGYITTKHGIINAKSSDDTLIIMMSHRNGRKVTSEVVRGDTYTEIIFSYGKRVPVTGDELTQNGSTFEVSGVRPNGEGYDVLNGNTGGWEPWVE
jgi:phosphoribosylformylglycinamidine (FGAM) synthase-like amidotransferase family enzyme